MDYVGLTRWLSETSNPSIDSAAEIAAMLAELPSEQQELDGILGML